MSAIVDEITAASCKRSILAEETSPSPRRVPMAAGPGFDVTGAAVITSWRSINVISAQVTDVASQETIMIASPRPYPVV